MRFEPAVVWPVTRPKVATGKIGDKLTVCDQAGEAQLEATVTRLKFSTGDEFDSGCYPQHPDLALLERGGSGLAAGVAQPIGA